MGVEQPLSAVATIHAFTLTTSKYLLRVFRNAFIVLDASAWMSCDFFNVNNNDYPQ